MDWMRRASQRIARAGLPSEAGFSLIEAIAAVFVAGTVLTGTVAAIGASANNAAKQEEAVLLTELARTQIELIQQAPYTTATGDYPAVQNVAEPLSVTFTSTDSGTTYSYPVTGETISNVVQQIAVTASGEFSSVTFTFYKIKPKWKRH